MNSVKLLTYNILRQNNMVNTEYDWEIRKSRIAYEVSKEDPDIFLLQECCDINKQSGINEFMKLYFESYKYQLFSAARNPKSNTLLIAYKHENFEVMGSQKFWLTENPYQFGDTWGNGNGRVIGILQLINKITKKIITVANIHYSLYTLAKINSSKLIVELLNKMNDNSITILAGDFNIFNTYEEKEITNIFNGGQFIDASKNLIDLNNNPIYGTFIGSDIDSSKFVPNQTYGKYDRIFVKNLDKFISYVPINDLSTKQSSDHLPIVLKLNF